ncbi:MerR family transcriptional regulator [Blautia sp. HCP3S3_G3]|uniref:MerR family transcriptional regulator n=1 Tax=Blautia sp. HCP3S3_G3 TaxID=3438913 RepID=UPI003F8AD13F
MTISEVSRKYNLTTDTLRYYERIGVIPQVHRTGAGLRDYTEEDCSWVELVKCMRSAGLPIEAIAEYVKLTQEGEATIPARRQLLVEQRAQLQEQLTSITRAMERLDYKISRYNEAIRTGILTWE